MRSNIEFNAESYLDLCTISYAIIDAISKNEIRVDAHIFSNCLLKIWTSIEDFGCDMEDLYQFSYDLSVDYLSIYYLA